MNNANFLKPLALILLFLTPSLPSAALGSSWHMVNVNSSNNVGDAHIIINGDVVTMIDAGDYELAKISLVPYLSKIGIKTIDHFFVSHPHNDHYTGIDALLENNVTIKNVYYNMPPDGVSDFAYAPDEFIVTLGNAKAQGAKLYDIGKGFKLAFPDSSEVKVLYAHKDRQLDGENLRVNDYSLILRWDTEGFRVLFVGDLSYQLGSYLSKYDFLKADILKVPHHGVNPIAPDEFFDTVAPQLNMFPTTSVLWSSSRIKQAKTWTTDKKIPHCVTGLNGNVALSFAASTLSIEPEISTNNCPRGRVHIVPGKQIKEPMVFPLMSLLLHKD